MLVGFAFPPTEVVH